MLFWIFFNKTWDYAEIWIHVFNNTKNTNFYNELFVHLLCESPIVLDYDEMNRNITFGVFLQYILK
jgi:hypothetical protein